MLALATNYSLYVPRHFITLIYMVLTHTSEFENERIKNTPF